MTDLKKSGRFLACALASCLIVDSSMTSFAENLSRQKNAVHLTDSTQAVKRSSSALRTASSSSAKKPESEKKNEAENEDISLIGTRSSEEDIEVTPVVTDSNYKFTVRDSPDGSEIWIDVTDWYTSANVTYNSTSFKHKECSSAFMLLFNDQKINSIGSTKFKGKYSYFSSSGNSEVSGSFKRTVNLSMGSTTVSGKKNSAELSSRDGGNFTLYHMYMAGSGMYNVAFVDCPGDYWDGNHQNTIEHPRTNDSCTFYAGPADVSNSSQITLKWTVTPISDDDLTNEKPLTRNCFRIKIAKKQFTDKGIRLTGIKPISFFGKDPEVIPVENNTILKDVSYSVKGVSSAQNATVLYKETKKAKDGKEVTETPRAITGYTTPAQLKFNAKEGYEAIFKYTPISYSISYSGLEEISGDNPNPASYTVEDDIILEAVSRNDGFNFTGWYDDKNSRVLKISKGSTGNKKLTARWSADIKDNNDGTYTYNSGSNKGKRFTYGADGEAGTDDDHEVSIGDDGAWGSSDDCFVLNTDGNHKVFKGKDNRFLTPESDSDDFYDNSRYTKDTYVKPGKNKYFEMDEKAPLKSDKDDELWWNGPDHVTGSDDDMIIKDFKHNSSGNLYVSAGSYIEYEDESILKPGKDLIFGTEDDLHIKFDESDDPYIENDSGTVTRPGADDEFLTEDDEVFLPGKDGIPGTEDDIKVYPGEDEIFGTEDDYYINDDGNKVFPGEDNKFGSDDDLMQKGEDIFKPGEDGIFGTEDDEKVEKPDPAPPSEEEEPEKNEGSDGGNSGGNSDNSGNSESNGSGDDNNSGNGDNGSGSGSSGGGSSSGSGHGSGGSGHSSGGSSGGSGGPNMSDNSYVDSGPGATSGADANTGAASGNEPNSGTEISKSEAQSEYKSETQSGTTQLSGTETSKSDSLSTSDKGNKSEWKGFSSDEVIEKVFSGKNSEKAGKAGSKAAADSKEKNPASESALPSIPKTGDESSSALIFALMTILSIAIMLLLYLKLFGERLIIKTLRKN